MTNSENVSTEVSQPSNPFRKFQSIKVVDAFKIGFGENNRIYSVFQDSSKSNHIDLDEATLKRYQSFLEHQAVHNNQDPGYLVKHEDGYISFSPSVAFENGFIPTDKMTMSAALNALKAGEFVSRDVWQNQIVIGLFSPEGISVVNGISLEQTVHFMAMYPELGRMSVWEPTGQDLMGDDWFIASFGPEVNSEEEDVSDTELE